MIKRMIQIPYQGQWDEIIKKCGELGMKPGEYFVSLHKNGTPVEVKFKKVGPKFDDAGMNRLYKLTHPSEVCGGCGEVNRACKC